jgi:hypothetical protein
LEGISEALAKEVHGLNMKLVGARLAELSAEIKAWESVSRSTDF